MTVNTQNQTTDQPVEQKVSDKELNFRKQEAMYQKMLAEKEARIAEMQRQMQQQRQPKQVIEDEDEDDDEDPYVDKRKLNKKLSSFEKSFEEKFEKKVEEKARRLLEEEKRNVWLKEHRDFHEIMSYAEQFANEHPDLAEDILTMPDGFERQKLVYRNIKALKVHEPKKAESSIQQRIDNNKKAPFYQPSGTGTAPYGGSSVGKDYSNTEMKNAYDHVLALKNRLRLG